MTAKESRLLQPGTSVFCTVLTGSFGAMRPIGWMTIESVRPRDGYLKLFGERMFCPPHNFRLDAPAS